MVTEMPSTAAFPHSNIPLSLPLTFTSASRSWAQEGWGPQNDRWLLRLDIRGGRWVSRAAAALSLTSLAARSFRRIHSPRTSIFPFLRAHWHPELPGERHTTEQREQQSGSSRSRNMGRLATLVVMPVRHFISARSP